MKTLSTLLTLSVLGLSMTLTSTSFAKSQVTVVNAKIVDQGANGCFPAPFCKGENLGILEEAVQQLGGADSARQLGIKKSLIGKTYSIPVQIDDSVCAQLEFAKDEDEIILPLTPQISKALVKSGGLRSATGGLGIVADSEQPRGFITVWPVFLKNADSLCK